MFTQALACSGITLTVDEEPGADGGTSAGSATSGGSGGNGGTGSGTGGNAAGGPATLPCDVFEAEDHPCVAAHSTVRLLRSAYDGPLYRVCKGPADPGPSSCMGAALDIGASADGIADVAAQDAFCGGVGCTISIVYDQSGHENHLEPSPAGSAKPTPSMPVHADDLPTTISGHAAYGMRFLPGMGYRAGCDGCTRPTGQGTAVGDEPQTIYMVTSSRDTLNGCCFDYGNAETSTDNDGNGAAEALYFGQGVIWGSGSGQGPWVMADLENGLYAGWQNGQDRNISSNQPLVHDFVTAVLVGDTAEQNQGKGRFALYGGDAQSGELSTQYDGIRPEKTGYVPMGKQGSIVLSISGDNSDGDGGRFYEGAMVSGAVSKEVLDAVQAALVAAAYGI
jgi:hypothetical protein